MKLRIRVTPEQHQIFQAKTRSAGFTKVAFYIHAQLFRTLSTEEKINAIYEKICKDK